MNWQRLGAIGLSIFASLCALDLARQQEGMEFKLLAAVACTFSILVVSHCDEETKGPEHD